MEFLSTKPHSMYPKHHWTHTKPHPLGADSALFCPSQPMASITAAPTNPPTSMPSTTLKERGPTAWTAESTSSTWATALPRRCSDKTGSSNALWAIAQNKFQMPIITKVSGTCIIWQLLDGAIVVLTLDWWILLSVVSLHRWCAASWGECLYLCLLR